MNLNRELVVAVAFFIMIVLAMASGIWMAKDDCRKGRCSQRRVK